MFQENGVGIIINPSGILINKSAWNFANAFSEGVAGVKHNNGRRNRL